MHRAIPRDVASSPLAKALAELAPGPHTHFALHVQASVFRLVDHLLHRHDNPDADALQKILRHYPFLAAYIRDGRDLLPAGTAWQHALVWWSTAITEWERGIAEHLPLRAVAATAGLGFDERLALVTAGLVEEDSRFGTLFAELQAPLAARRAGLELLGRVHGSAAGDRDGWSLCRPLLAAGLLDAADHRLPRAEWTLAVAPALWDALRGAATETPGVGLRWLDRAQARPLDRMALTPELRARARQLPALLEEGAADGVVLRGPGGSERGELARMLAAGVGRHVIAAEPARLDETEGWRRLGPLCTATRSMPVLRYALGPGESVEPPDLPGYAGPVGYVLGTEGGLGGARAARLVTLTLAMPDLDQRRAVWRAALAGRPCPELEAAAERYLLPAGHIRRIAGMAAAQAALAGRREVTLADLGRAAQSLSRETLHELAEALEPTPGWDRLVVRPEGSSKLRELAVRARHRERLGARLGRAFAGNAHRGVRALFTGPSGTGKTLAARILAAEIGKDLYRVDLAAVINKYIGETEKNLHKVLARAEELDVVLLLDEGDALLGKRTEVRGANDRYANFETNYLLQRIEGHQGIVLITTNAAERIDTAFERRMDVVVPFLPPAAAERLRIWRLHLPEDRSVDIEHLTMLATRCRMTGGQIRNAALLAAVYGLDDRGCERAIAPAHLEAAVLSEYRKAGAICPLGEAAPAARHKLVGRQGFMGGLARTGRNGGGFEP
jgi:hypothetical protein